MNIPIDQDQTTPRPAHAGTPVLLQNGFRVFFLFAGVYAAVLVPLWLAAYLGEVDFSGWPAAVFHSHELVFGYAVAAISGFLLTAAPNWDRTLPTKGIRLGVLALAWLAGRAAIWFSAELGTMAVMITDMAFLPLLLAIGVPRLVTSKSRRNKVFVVIIVLLAAANLMMHLYVAGYISHAGAGWIAVDVVALLIAILGGRVTPAFTQGAINQKLGPGKFNARLSGKIDTAGIALVTLLVLGDFVDGLYDLPPGLLPGLAFAAGITNLFRMRGWGTMLSLGQPIVWSLHLGFAWLGAGLVVRGLAGALDLGAMALHGITIGAIGTMTLAIMSRAALGHTGRALVTPGPVVASYLLVSVAAISRLLQPFLDDLGSGDWGLVLAAGAWSIAFSIFSISYLPILAKSRVDGRHGGH